MGVVLQISVLAVKRKDLSLDPRTHAKTPGAPVISALLCPWGWLASHSSQTSNHQAP